MLDLQELKRKAEAADKNGTHIYTNPRDANNWRANDEWHVAASPGVFLSLIAEVESLRKQLEEAKNALVDAYMTGVEIEKRAAIARLKEHK